LPVAVGGDSGVEGSGSECRHVAEIFIPSEEVDVHAEVVNEPNADVDAAAFPVEILLRDPGGELPGQVSIPAISAGAGVADAEYAVFFDHDLPTSGRDERIGFGDHLGAADCAAIARRPLTSAQMAP
jgi:hypothetical protein